MRLIAYQPQNSIPELAKLCLKLIKNGDPVLIRVGSPEKAKELSESFWKGYVFLPHGLIGEEFDSLQPVVISHENTQRDVFINFEQVYTRHTELPYTKSFILWNCASYDSSFKVYKQNQSGTWVSDSVPSDTSRRY